MFSVDLAPSYRHRKSIGEEVRFDHTLCGDTKSRLYVRRVATGYIYHCHNCGYNGRYHEKGTLPPSETLSRLQEKPVGETLSDKPVGEFNLPSDFTEDLPDAAAKWFLKYGITKREAGYNGFGYSPATNRLILPVMDSTQSDWIYYQGRNLGVVDKENPKYLNVRAKGVKNVFFKSSIEEAYQGNKVVIVEDILSAIKVGRYVQCYALLGSYMPMGLIDELKDYSEVIIWLDNDKAQASYKYANEFSKLLGIPFTPFVTTLDPKECADSYIKNTCKKWSA